MDSSLQVEVDSIVSFHCLDGYGLVGNEELACNSYGQWSGEVPICIRTFTFSDVWDLHGYLITAMMTPTPTPHHMHQLSHLVLMISLLQTRL